MVETKQWLTIKEAAEALGRTYPTVNWWVREGLVKHRKIPRGVYTGYRISTREVERVRKLLASGMPISLGR